MKVKVTVTTKPTEKGKVLTARAISAYLKEQGFKVEVEHLENSEVLLATKE